MPEYTVTSEIYKEHDYKTTKVPHIDGNIVSEFPFLLPKKKGDVTFDEDGDLDVERPTKEAIVIEHRPETNIHLVGLQVWRGAFLLGDLLIHLGLHGKLEGKTLLELGAGTGLTSFVAAMYAEKVICTDINAGGILDLIKLNSEYNSKIMRSQFKITELDFQEQNKWSNTLQSDIRDTDIIIAADVVYDDDITTALIATIRKILNTKPPKTLYLAVEKRYVFTVEHLDSVAPCYETFLDLLDKVNVDNGRPGWTVRRVPLVFPKYFTYDRVDELVLWEITSR